MPDAIKQLESGDIAPVYYLCGEAYPRDRLAVAIRRAVVGDHATAFNFDAFDGKDTDVGKILAAARTLPMLGGRRLVQVRGAEALGADDLNRMLDYVKDPSPQSCLLFIASKADLRLKFFNAVKKHGVLERFEALKERNAPGWVTTEARREKIGLAPGTAERIADAVGTDMAQLASALERLSLYVGGEREITPDDVEEVLAQTRQRSIFELTNAVGRGDRREAMLVLRRMMAAREPGVRIVAMLARHLRQLWQASELATAGAPQKTIAAKLGIHPFFIKDLVAQGRRFDGRALQRTHRALYELDGALKSSRLSDALLLDQLVLTLCPPAAR